MNIEQHILSRLPYAKPFRFVDGIVQVDAAVIEGYYHLAPELDFYKGHFPGRAITPGVILTEIMAQLGLACHGLYLAADESGTQGFPFALTASAVSFYRPVLPGTTVRIKSIPQYFRFGKLKCHAQLFDEAGALVCEGTLEGVQLKDSIWNAG